MFLSRFQLDPKLASVVELRRIADSGSVHTTVWEWFGDDPDRNRDFLFRVEPGSPVRIWTLSRRRPIRPSSPWATDTKEFAPLLQTGDRLEFTVRVNPTFRAKAGDGAGRRHDVVMQEKRRLRAEGEKEGEALITQRVCSDWFLKRTESMGIEVPAGSLRADGYAVQRFRRKQGSPASVATVDLTGHLTILDPSRFVESVMTGVGPAKAFGCGLMLIKRA